MKYGRQKKENIDILVVDDDPAIQRMMRRILGRIDYNVFMASSGQDAFAKIADNLPDLIMLDLLMPNIDGFEVAAYLRDHPETQEIPIILITGLDTSQNHVKAMDLGVNDFLSKTAEPEEILTRIRSHLKIKNLNDQLSDYRASTEKTVALRTAQLKNASLEIIWRLTAASEYRDNETGAHIQIMSQYSADIGMKMGLPKKTVETILYGASMHDIGKIGIPDGILLKPDKLDSQELEIVKTHPIIGANILKGSIEKSNRIIEEGRKSHFDPTVVDAFLLIQNQILNIKEKFQDEKQNPMWYMDHMANDGSLNSIFESIAI